jgi:hypothetical protein
MSSEPATDSSPRRGNFAVIPWLIAALGALGMLLLGLQASAARQEAEALQLQLELKDLELRDAANRLEAERLLINRQIDAAKRDAQPARPPARGPQN